MAPDGRLKMGKGTCARHGVSSIHRLSNISSIYRLSRSILFPTTAIYLTVAPPRIPNVPPGLSPPPHITPLSRRQLTDSQIIPPLLAPTDPITFAALVPSAPPTEPITFAALVTSVHPALVTSAPPRSPFSAPPAALVPFAPPAALIPSTPPAALVFGFCAVHAPALCFDLAVHLFHAH
ncbi:hypothetical protein P692DRAFT_20876312 [Suillus brevipes Sb2]|nr:hypothetical protein P692DRAFT_20876312 [Suillus brevipes Sb2]